MAVFRCSQHWVKVNGKFVGWVNKEKRNNQCTLVA